MLRHRQSNEGAQEWDRGSWLRDESLQIEGWTELQSISSYQVLITRLDGEEDKRLRAWLAGGLKGCSWWISLHGVPASSSLSPTSTQSESHLFINLQAIFLAKSTSSPQLGPFLFHCHSLLRWIWSRDQLNRNHLDEFYLHKLRPSWKGLCRLDPSKVPRKTNPNQDFPVFGFLVFFFLLVITKKYKYKNQVRICFESLKGFTVEIHFRIQKAWSSLVFFFLEIYKTFLLVVVHSPILRTSRVSQQAERSKKK